MPPRIMQSRKITTIANHSGKRQSGAPQSMLVEEAAAGLVSFIDDSGALVMACRRVLARQTTSGPLVWLAAHILASPDPRGAARECVERITIDRTARRLANWLPRDATVCVLGWPDLTSTALAQRPDVHGLVVDVHGEGSGLARWLDAQDLEADDVPTGGLGAAVTSADVVVIEADPARAASDAELRVADQYGVGGPPFLIDVLAQIDEINLDLEGALEPVFPPAQGGQNRQVLSRQGMGARAKHVGQTTLADHDGRLTLTTDEFGPVFDLVVVVREPPNERIAAVVEPLDDVDQLIADEAEDSHG